MQMYIVDTETVGLNSPVVLIQYQLIDTDETDKDNEKIVLHDVWGTPICETLDLIESFCSVGVIYFNGVFDHYHLQRLYNTLVELIKAVGNVLPEDHIDLFAELEPKAMDGDCIKPLHILDLFLYARKGSLQSVSMNRANVTIRKVPNCLSGSLQKKLEEVIAIDDVYFARRKEYKEYDWDVESNKQDPLFSDLTLRFKPSIALKVLAQHVLGFDETLTMFDVAPPAYPISKGWCPCALSLCPDGAANNWRCKINTPTGYKKGYAWPYHIKNHIAHWRYNELARRYATDDITYTRDLYYYFRDEEDSTLQVDDDDSILAAQVGSSRWRGYSINVPRIKELRAKAVSLSEKAPKAPKKVFDYISPYLSETEINILGGSTKKTVLEALSKAFEPCMTCLGTGEIENVKRIPSKAPKAELISTSIIKDKDTFVGTDELEANINDARSFETMINKQPSYIPSQIPCPDCHGTGHTDVPHPARKYAQDCLDARSAQKKVEMWDKLLEAGRFHASFKIIGTFTSRLAGADGLNPQGIEHSLESRACFPLSFGELVLVGGDFMSFEVSIVDAVSNDPKLRTELCRCAECKYVWTLDEFATHIDCPNCHQQDGVEPCRQKFHGLFGMALKPGLTYDEIVATKGTDDDLYDKGKRGGFALTYGGNFSTLVDRLGVTEEVALDAVEWFGETFPGTKKFRDDIEDDFCSMKQPDGIGTRVEWHDPKPYVESLLGHRRYFTLENRICKKLFNLSNKLPPNWKEIKGKCVRREREQTMAGAMMSALYAAAFNIQGKNLRAAANHTIQSTGAQITKDLQTRLWGLQPVGVHPWNVQPLNVHDEIMLPIRPELKEKAKEIVDQLVQDYRSTVPLIAIGWNNDMKTWADK